MVDLYVSPSCTSCRKARAWLEKHNIPFKERNIFSEPLTKKELLKILRMTENGTEEIISTRSRAFQQLRINLDDLSIDQLLDLVEKNPSLLRRPSLWMIVDFKLVTMKMKFVDSCHEKFVGWNWLKHKRLQIYKMIEKC